MSDALRTVFYPRHVDAGAKIVEFGGWDMPLQFEGILQEHLTTRKGAGLFDVSHMGRFVVRGAGVPRLNGRGRGNLICVVEIEVPKKLSREQKRLLKDLDATFE